MARAKGKMKDMENAIWNLRRMAVTIRLFVRGWKDGACSYQDVLSSLNSDVDAVRSSPSRRASRARVIHWPLPLEPLRPNFHVFNVRQINGAHCANHSLRRIMTK